MKSRGAVLVVVSLVLGLAGPGAAVGVRGELQEVPRLTWLVPGFLPDGGLVTVGLGGSRYHPGYNPTGGPAHYDVLQSTLFVHWSPRSWLAISGSQHWRAWSRYLVAGQPESGSGLADGALRAAVAVPGLPTWLGVVLWAGGNVPIGSVELGEDAFSPEVGGTLSVAFWRDGQLPELRLHASVGQRWNRNETVGFGTGQGPQPQPWFPQYPAAQLAGGERENDFLCWGFALEFRQAAASLWLEWSVASLHRTRYVSRREDQQILAAGLIWGLREGWAVHSDYQVGLWLDDLDTEWYPRHPHQAFSLAVSRQFGLNWP
jgi:hypothetical protein